MEFLQNLVIPQSSEHIKLLHYLLMLLLFLFVPFISVVFGGASISLYFKNRGLRESNDRFLRFSKEIIETVTLNKSVGIILGIVPLLAAVLIYAQLLHNTTIAAISYLVASFFTLSVGLILIYAYRYSMSFMDIFNAIKEFKPQDESVTEEIRKFRKGNLSLNLRAGRFGIFLMFIALWLFIAGITLAIFPAQWKTRDLFYILFSWQVLTKYFYFLSAAFAITGGVILFSYFYWEGGKKNLSSEYSGFIRKTGIRVTFTAALSMPFFMFVNIFALPKESLSGGVFTFSVIALILLFIGFQLLYAMVKAKDSRFSGQVFFVILFAIFALIIKDQLAMNNATQLQSIVLSAKYEDMMAELTGTNKVPEVSGEQIFKNICSSCHSFDHKVVGPPYKQTLPKYEGHIDQLIAFIRNPVKKNPDYPPMPNPGLRPNEAKAVANYIMSEYKKK